jgi:hypothetical protein
MQVKVTGRFKETYSRIRLEIKISKISFFGILWIKFE